MFLRGVLMEKMDENAQLSDGFIEGNGRRCQLVNLQAFQQFARDGVWNACDLKDCLDDFVKFTARGGGGKAGTTSGSADGGVWFL